MSFKCNQCGKTVHKVEDVRNCLRCGQMSGSAALIPAHHDDSDFLTPAIIGYMLGSSFSAHDSPAPTIGDDTSMTGGGGSFSGAGAGGSWDDSSSSGSSNDSSSSYDSGSSSSDSGSSSGGGSD